MTIEQAEKKGKLKDCILETDSQDVKATLEYIGKPRSYKRWGGLFTKAENGDIICVYAFKGIIPYNHKTLTKLK